MLKVIRNWKQVTQLVGLNRDNMKYLTLSLLVLWCFTVSSAQSLEFKVDAGKTIGKNTRFWKASGTDLLYYLAEKPSGQALLDRMQETESCVYLRNHYTLTRHIREGLEVGIKSIQKIKW